MEINNRLKHAIASGLMARRKPEKIFKPVEKIKDLFGEYSDYYTKQTDDTVRDLNLPQANFISIPRKSSQPFLKRQIGISPTKGLLEDTFTAAKALWAYFEMTGEQNPFVLELPMTNQNFELFMKPLIDDLIMSPIGGMFEDVEEMLYEGRFYFDMPCVHGDEDGAGMFQSFLEGPVEVAGQLIHYMSAHNLHLNKKDVKLIRKLGLVKLTRFYAEYTGEKKLDLKKLSNCGEHYFAEVDKKYPHLQVDHFSLVTYDCGSSLSMFSAEEIDCAVMYCKAYEKLTDDMPCYWEMDNNECRVTESIIEDICKVYRRAYVPGTEI